MPIFFTPQSTSTHLKVPLHVKLTTWFKAILPRKNKSKTPRRTKPSRTIKPTVQIPLKYSSDSRPYMWVGGKRVAFTPSQVHQLKQGRSSFDPIEEDDRMANSSVTASDDDESY